MKEHDIELERLKTGLQTYLEMNKAAVDFSKRAIQGAFLLNGGAATALLASKGAAFAGFACSFGIGAFLSVVAMALAYATNLAVAETWACYITPRTAEEHLAIFRKFQQWLYASIAVGVTSGLWFLGTLFNITQRLP